MEQKILNDPKVNEALELLNSSARQKEKMLRGAVNNVSVEAAKKVRQSPLLFLGGVAVASLIIGYFAGRSHE